MNTFRPMEFNDQSVHFCGCKMDSETQTLQTNSDFVRLRSKLWYVLYELVSKPNKLISRDYLIRHIWRGNCYTGEQGLTHAICHLRRILDNYQIDAKIITLPKKGYILQFQTNETQLSKDTVLFEQSKSALQIVKNTRQIQQRFKYPLSY